MALIDCTSFFFHSAVYLSYYFTCCNVNKWLWSVNWREAILTCFVFGHYFSANSSLADILLLWLSLYPTRFKFYAKEECVQLHYRYMKIAYLVKAFPHRGGSSATKSGVGMCHVCKEGREYVCVHRCLLCVCVCVIIPMHHQGSSSTSGRRGLEGSSKANQQDC